MVAVVTGSSRGIGFAIAKAFASRGMQVVLTARKEDELRKAAAALGSGSSVHTVRADIRKPADADLMVKDTVQRFGGVDVLVNNAGVGKFANVADFSIDDWQQVLETNLSGAFYCCRAAIPEMKRRGGGYIVNISSLAGKNPFAGGAAYCASKSALNAFSEALMQEVRYDNIRVSYIMPGSVSTGFGVGGESELSTRLGADWKIAPEDVAEVVVELVTLNQRSLASRVELRPSRPPRKG
ncbi:MAG: short-chain dehydrogenase [Acidobacteria bacterium]|nr:MAG: short-chain dehydrogenase [Acidobacteriota bacterium]